MWKTGWRGTPFTLPRKSARKGGIGTGLISSIEISFPCQINGSIRESRGLFLAVISKGGFFILCTLFCCSWSRPVLMGLEPRGVFRWYAAWDLAFHMVTLASMDPYFAKSQMTLFLREWYMHPNGQLPAYEWNFSDVNPPVHAWGCWCGISNPPLPCLRCSLSSSPLEALQKWVFAECLLTATLSAAVICC